MMVTLLMTAALAMACGGAPVAGPSALPEAPPAGTLAVAQAFPAGLDPAYVRALAQVDAAGRPKRWEGGAFRHCFDASVEPYRADLEAVADRMTAVSGIPRTTAGVCNVEWVSDDLPGHTFATIFGTSTSIVRATVTVRVKGPHLAADALHEAGHVLGLGHSPKSDDLMNATVGRQQDFSADELAVLGWVYR